MTQFGIISFVSGLEPSNAIRTKTQRPETLFLNTGNHTYDSHYFSTNYTQRNIYEKEDIL